MRAENIKSKLKYCNSQLQELYSILFGAQLSNKKVEDISHLVGDIISNTNDCFDYCAKDMFETFILPKLTSKEINNYNKGTTKVYFPFYEKDLNRGSFQALGQHNKKLYVYLLSRCRAADHKEKIGRIKFDYVYARNVRKLVNDKKHNNVIEITNDGDLETVIDGNGFQAIIPPTKLRVVADGGVKNVVRAHVYQLESTGEEIKELCSCAQVSTRRILGEIYNKFLNIKLW